MVSRRATQAPVKGQTDWMTIGAIGLGGGALVFGLIYYFKGKPFGLGDKIFCLFKYQHAGPGGPYRLRLVMGHTIGEPPLGWFDEMAETMQEFDIEVPPSDTLEDKKSLATYEIPAVLAKDKYDLEASMRYPDGSIVSGMRVIANDIIVVD